MSKFDIYYEVNPSIEFGHYFFFLFFCSNMAYFHGPWFVTPSETPSTPSQLFYKQEAFISTIQDSNPLLSVVGRCCVLELEDYKSQRPTTYEECDVYVCESLFDESRRQIRPLPPTGLKTYEHVSTDVLTDETFYFKRKIVVVKVTSFFDYRLWSFLFLFQVL